MADIAVRFVDKFRPRYKAAQDVVKVIQSLRDKGLLEPPVGNPVFLGSQQ